jgi:iron complex outermembrane receptor protein
MKCPERCGVLLITTLFLFVDPSWAQDESDVPRDSLRQYDLAGIVVAEPGARDARLAGSSIHRVSLARLTSARGDALAEAMTLVPGAHVQTNSRGEQIVYIRGAGERQVSLLLDGAPLNIPWDNRMDLDMLPASMLGGMTVVRGISTSSFGPNSAGGVIQLETRTVTDPEGVTELDVGYGTGRDGQVHGLVSGSARRWSWTGMASILGRSGLPVASDADLPFNQSGPLRTNTDKRRATAFGRMSWSDRLGVSLLHVDGRKGVAPEGHLPPESDEPRFWRYPEWTFSTVVAGGRLLPGWDVSLWWSRFTQTIDAYPDSRYSVPDGRQRDRDLSLGVRSRMESLRGTTHVVWSVFGAGSVHDQQEIHLAGLNRMDLDESFGQILVSTGVDITKPFGRGMHWGAGGSLDGQFMPQTGDKPARDPFLDWTGHLSWHYRPEGRFSFQAAAGRKVRFPTMRELFGEALNRFVVNTGLRPESVWMGEWTIGYRQERARLDVTVFQRITRHTIDQEWVESVDGTKRRRVNLEGSHSTGLDGVFRLSLPGRVRLDAHASVMRHRARQRGTSFRMIEKPERLARLDVEKWFLGTWSAHASVTHRGPAWGMSASTGTVRLPAASTLDGQLRWRSILPGTDTFVDARVGVRNVRNVAVVPQMGLPSPGRSYHARLSITL